MALKLIIDTDPGIDDAMAIFYAIADPKIELLALTTVFGNVTTPQATRNAMFLLEEAGVALPVSSGLHQPRILPPFPTSSSVHGDEGFGRLKLIEPKGIPEVEPAPEFLVRMAREHKGEIILCPIGPLTNVAAAIDLDPDFCKNLNGIVIMGGSLGAGGNITAAAEANIYHDPHAADHVFKNGCNITLVGLDVTDRVICPREFFQALALESPRIGGMLSEMTDFYINFYESIGKTNGCSMHDPTALVACVNMNFFKTELHKLCVTTSGDRIGETVSDINCARSDVKVCVDVDILAVKNKFFSNVAKLY
jgi:inosine-uridine nucleoside N-ribohydrolase